MMEINGQDDTSQLKQQNLIMACKNRYNWTKMKDVVQTLYPRPLKRRKQPSWAGKTVHETHKEDQQTEIPEYAPTTSHYDSGITTPQDNNAVDDSYEVLAASIASADAKDCLREMQRLPSAEAKCSLIRRRFLL